VINTSLEVRPATAGDLAALNDVYNQYVRETHYTFDIEPMTMDARYDTSIETSVYLVPESVGRGAGSRLYEELFKALEGEAVHRAYAGIALPNPASIALHERFGFKRVAHFTEQGRKFERYWDVAWYEKPLGPESIESSEG